MHRKESFPRAVAESYHDRCVKLLLALSAEDSEVRNGTALASTCLLRSYEILAEDEDPNRHLFGASTLLPPIPALTDHSLLAGCFWNYLREDITYSLIHECPLKVHVDRAVESLKPNHPDEYANCMTLLLGRAVNVAFGGQNDDVLPELMSLWRERPVPFSRIDERPFPSIRMTRDAHAFAIQYHHVARCLLRPEERPLLAADICGLAISSDSAAIVVNSYGPICFTAKWLSTTEEQQTLVDFLRSSERRTGWSVSLIITKLRQTWEAHAETASR
jgi:hypothetical protein